MAHSSSSLGPVGAKRVDYVEAKDENFAEQMRKLSRSVWSALGSGGQADPEVLGTLWGAPQAELSRVLQDTGVEGSLDVEQLKVLVSLAERSAQGLRRRRARVAPY